MENCLMITFCTELDGRLLERLFFEKLPAIYIKLATIGGSERLSLSLSIDIEITQIYCQEDGRLQRCFQVRSVEFIALCGWACESLLLGFAKEFG